jgi:hypothetical protein
VNLKRLGFNYKYKHHKYTVKCLKTIVVRWRWHALQRCDQKYKVPPFQEGGTSRIMTIRAISTNDQLLDIFTKSNAADCFASVDEELWDGNNVVAAPH